ncbi:MAG: DNA replication/repair protein RecF [Luteimonas sp.]
MQVTRLTVSNLRRFEQVSFAPAAGLNLITGENGAGKTSLLEALHLMAYGRSFRGRVHEGLIRSGSPALEVFVEWSTNHHSNDDSQAGGPLHKAGLRHGGQGWEGRLDGRSVSHLGEFCAALAVITVEPGSHDLIMGRADGRRRFLDWGLFHVEPDFLPLWRRYARALKQRNTLLKTHSAPNELEAWEQEMSTAGERLTQHRQHYLEHLQPQLQAVLSALLPAAVSSTLDFQPGWRRDELTLADALLLARDRDLASGFTSIGPHRADWRIEHSGIPGRSALSRGQAKLTALSALLAQAEHHAQLHGQWPVVALDDLASELDRDHQRRVLERLLASGAQVLVTGTEIPIALRELGAEVSVFHVEHGQIRPEARLSSLP